MSPQYERLNRWIDQLQADQHPELEPADDPAEEEVLAAATAWAALRPGADEPDPAFLANLRSHLFADAPGEGEGPAGTPPIGQPRSPSVPVAGAAPPASPAPVRPAVAQAPPPPAPPSPDRRVVPASTFLERRVSRRSLLGAMSAAAAGLVAGLGLQNIFTQQEVGGAKAAAAAAQEELEKYEALYGDRTPPAGQLPDGQGKWFAVAHLNDVQIGEAIPITMGAVKGFLVRDGAAEFNALSGVCTHLGCDLGWVSKTHAFVCGCHGSSFDATGAALTGPALYYVPLRHLPVFSWKVQNDIVYVLA